MKVLIDGRVLRQKHTTGVQRYTSELLKSFDTAGFKYDLAYPKSENRFSQHLWEHTALPCQSSRYDILFCPGNIAPLWKPRNTKLATTIHSLAFIHCPDSYTYMFRNYYKAVMPEIISSSDVIFSGSEYEKGTIEDCYPSAKGKVHAIQNGVSDVFLSQPIETSKDNYILYVGSLNPLKNVRRVTEAFLYISDKIPFTLKIVGPVPPVFQTEKFISNDRIQYVGPVEDENELAALYKRAVMLVFPSLYEASPLPPVEAMACGCPVLTSDIPAIRERCGSSALYCDPRSTGSIAQKMLELTSDADMRNTFAEKGRQHAKAFSWKKTADETMRLLKICNKSTSGRT